MIKVCKHVKYGDPDLWKMLHVLYNDNTSVPSGSLMGMISPLFKGKGFKSCEKDNHMGITMFPVIILKVLEVILLRRLENLAKEKSIFPTFGLAFLQVQGLPLFGH